MAKKSDGLVADRPVLSLRPQASLKQRLDEAAEANGRSMAREAEVRLEASFESTSASKLERFIKTRPGLVYLLDTVTPLEFTNQLGDVLQSVVRHAGDRSWSERQTRDALTAAMAVVSHYYFWRGESAAPVPDVRPTPAADTKMKDLPAALAGYLIAEEQLLHSASLQDHALYNQTVDRKIANVWSGDGRAVEELSSPAPPAPAKRRSGLKASGSVVAPEELGSFKPAPPTWFRVLTEREAGRQPEPDETE